MAGGSPPKPAPESFTSPLEANAVLLAINSRPPAGMTRLFGGIRSCQSDAA
jgi:hypothetical protein